MQAVTCFCVYFMVLCFTVKDIKYPIIHFEYYIMENGSMC